MILGLTLGCGYSFQTSKNPPIAQKGIKKVYIAPLVNNTYKAGIENIVYNELVRTMSAYGRITLVQNKIDADAVLNGTVSSATYSTTASTTVSSLNPVGFGNGLVSSPFSIATEYMANLNCTFSLNELKSKYEKEKVKLEKKGKSARGRYVWSGGFSRAKPFPASNQLDVPGTTSALINDSEFDRALLDLARSMMNDVHEAMLAMF